MPVCLKIEACFLLYVNIFDQVLELISFHEEINLLVETLLQGIYIARIKTSKYMTIVDLR